MKTRTGYVSNSSSSSFMIKKKDITPLQLYLIRHGFMICGEIVYNHPEILEEYDLSYHKEYWDIRETDEEIYGDTMMDNFSMGEYLRFIGVPEDKIYIDRDE